MINFKRASDGAFTGVMHSTGKPSTAAVTIAVMLRELSEWAWEQNAASGGFRTQRDDEAFTVVEWVAAR